MTEIQSNFSAAARCAERLGQASEKVANAGASSIVQAEKTTILGNQEALTTNQTVQKMVLSFQQGLIQDIAHVQSVAKEFEYQDVQLKQLFDFTN
ncbi:TIGR04197 family type VII secretion effector [Listeria sp. FSL L7-1485]|uniref:TIGR04197 family type VII secretion effector n=1 Tax=Listeria immobilis TaxID=2713502 RepID=A0A7X0X9N5_9LIST|nr:TIGR04197 family type VII secretion effector [Listeria immobilis]MBC1483973.1 TIGR04197 family type VII secretion effector [Listeria immobilis]MBC1490185.1 TIGR04197 family type VII secretion effector [Listeria immobilis]MBC1508182.1 TIGR04197 family type VII secretion effector [Listeria immobilis]MBC1511198.1 TIGR04197 family type VII secretion effector [Listeria immobilis]MBC1537237.1 TIGR04197 family type VII secretion effector [Listeria immobilis]